MARGRPGIADTRPIDTVHATGHHGLMRGLAASGFGRSHVWGVHGTKPCGGIGQVSTRRRCVARLEGWMSTRTQRLGASGRLCWVLTMSRGPWPWFGQTGGHGSGLCPTGLGGHWLLKHWRGRCVLQARRFSPGHAVQHGLPPMPFQMRLSVDNRTAMLEARVRPKPGWRLASPQGRMN